MPEPATQPAPPPAEPGPAAPGPAQRPRFLWGLIVAIVVLASVAGAAMLGIAAFSGVGQDRLARQGIDPLLAVP